jgi:N-acetylglucosamine kinase-like BadF-type ATPase
MAYFLAIDGGGTRTTAWLANEAGRVLGRARAGPSNPLKVGFAAAQRELLRAARAAIAVAAVSHRRAGRRTDLRPPQPPALGQRRRSGVILDAVCAGLAGVDRAQVHGPLMAWLRKALPARHHLLTVDAAITLRAALGREPGIIVIAGTGSIAYGQDAQGHILRAGGWGIPFDDLGSGYDLGRKAVAAALQDYDRRGPHTLLMRRICRALGLQNITQVVTLPLTQDQIAALAPLVVNAARRGDRAARILCWQAGMYLAELASTLIRQLGWRRRHFRIFCAGGVFKSSAAIRAVFKHFLRSAAPRAEVHLLRREPVEGALALAREMVNPCP